MSHTQQFTISTGNIALKFKPPLPLKTIVPTADAVGYAQRILQMSNFFFQHQVMLHRRTVPERCTQGSEVGRGDEAELAMGPEE